MKLFCRVHIDEKNHHVALSFFTATSRQCIFLTVVESTSCATVEASKNHNFICPGV
jgi:hypothetical protein